MNLQRCAVFKHLDSLKKIRTTHLDPVVLSVVFMELGTSNRDA